MRAPAFLCGRDPLTGRDFSHRRDWILVREEQLAGLFAIEVEFHAELSNHLHLMLRSRPDVARRWSPHEVARRYLTAMKIAKCMSDELPQVSDKRIEQVVRDKKRIKQLRRRLSNISWFMGILCENIDRRSEIVSAHFRRACSVADSVQSPLASHPPRPVHPLLRTTEPIAAHSPRGQLNPGPSNGRRKSVRSRVSGPSLPSVHPRPWPK